MSLILILSLVLKLSFAPLLTINDWQNQLSNVQATYQFGEQATVEAHLPQFDTVDSITVSLQPENGPLILSQAQIFGDGDLSASFNLKDNPIQVFDRVYYWFDITNRDGTVYTSPSYWFDYLDNRFEWQKSESKWFTVYSSPANKLAVSELQEIALAGLKRATSILPVSPELPLIIYVYPNLDSLQIALGKSGQDWAVGEAKPDLGVILVSESEDINNRQELERQIPHEIAHLLEYSAADGNYDYVPAWLLEGLASNAENYLSPDNTRLLQNAYQSNTLISLEQLCSSFPPEASQSTLAYAESASFISYLLSEYGNDKIFEMLQSSHNGMTCSQLTSSLLGKDLATLESEWLALKVAQNPRKSAWVDFWPLLLIVPIILIVLFLIKRHGKSKIPENNQNAK